VLILFFIYFLFVASGDCRKITKKKKR